MNGYPMVFVHGYNGWGSGEGLNGLLPYWGATTGDLMKHLIFKGYDCYSASVGPVSSAWDRACELYAQLTGTTVDYGEAHSRKYGHKRFGRTYQKPLFDGWSESKKIHLIGHSFGGTTVRLLTHLLTNGCQDEIDASGEDVSPLFTGGKEFLVASITTICTPHNSSSIYKMVKSFKLYEFMFLITALYCGTLGRTRINGNLVDFHLEQFGLTNTPGKKDADRYMRSIMRFLKNNSDTCEHDLLPESTEEINSTIKISPDVYYFSYAFNSMTDTKLPMAILGSNPVIAPLGFWMAHQKQFRNEITGQVYGKEWKPNDLLCNTVSEKYPFNEPHTDYYGKNVKPGIWNVMPVQKGDHGTAIGLFADRQKTQAFYIELAELLSSLENKKENENG
jgi:triacylglycerol lipase